MSACESDNVDPTADLTAGKKAFAQKCSSCHVLARANAKGRQDPNLDESFRQALRGSAPVRRRGIRGSSGARCRSAACSFVLETTIHEGGTVKYALLIYDTPDAWAGLSEQEHDDVFGEYMQASQAPGVYGGAQLQPPDTATTVRVDGGQTLLTVGPFIEA